MRYAELVRTIAASSGVDEEAIRSVLFALPEGLTRLTLGDRVRTPLGTFRMTRRAERHVTAPGQEFPVAVAPQLVVKMRAGSRLRPYDPSVDVERYGI